MKLTDCSCLPTTMTMFYVRRDSRGEAKVYFGGRECENFVFSEPT